MARGDHIYVYRTLRYSHHGIDCGDGTVIHFSGEPGLRSKKAKADASITRASMEEFLKGGKLRTRAYGDRDDAETTVARAESELGSKNYSLRRNNCEHFATWCCTGRSASEQVRGGYAVAGHGAAVLASLAGTGRALAALGSVPGLSGPGIMTGLSAAGRAIGGGAAQGPLALALLPTTLSVFLMRRALRDDPTLDVGERTARRAGRNTAQVAAPVALVTSSAVLYSAGVTGASGAGIMSGLTAVGGVVGGGAVAGATIAVSWPVLAVAGAGTVTYVSWRTVKKRRHRNTSSEEGDAGPNAELE